MTDPVAQTAYDAFGYDYQARRFSGLYENADRDSRNNTGDQTRLEMQWNDLLNLRQPELSQPGASVTNLQEGAYVGPDGKTYFWRYSVKLEYTGPGSPLWGYFTKDRESYFDSGNSPAPLYKPPVLPRPGP